jgi:DNA-binding helix-hairpin-helix protein with protein kinase domain
MPAQIATKPRVLTCSRTNEPITLIKQIASSGEGEIWRTNLAGCLAKLYHSPDLQKVGKLEVMIANPPQDPNAQIQHTSFAWPQSLLKNDKGETVGFLMPQIQDSVEILDVYNPKMRQQIVPGFNWLYLHATAVNIASIVASIHKGGYVLGDIKPQNILVNNRALAAIIDTDSFQVKDLEKELIYHCPVGSEGFTPPELLDKDLATTQQTEIHDRFRLGVIIYLLLFGDHPFKGQWVGKGDSPEPNELLRQGYWPYGVKSPIQPGLLTIPLTTLHPELQKCFHRCFTDGYHHPELRPSAQKWSGVLQLALKELKVCRHNPRHYYSTSYGKCYWCDRQRLLGVDIFPKELTWLEAKSKLLSTKLKREVKKTQIKAAKLQKPPKSNSLANAKNAKSNPLQSAKTPKALVKSQSNPLQVSKIQTFKSNLLASQSLGDRKVVYWGLGSSFAISGLILALVNVGGEGEMNSSQWGSTMFAIAIGLGLLGMAGLLLKWTRTENI